MMFHGPPERHVGVVEAIDHQLPLKPIPRRGIGDHRIPLHPREMQRSLHLTKQQPQQLAQNPRSMLQLRSAQISGIPGDVTANEKAFGGHYSPPE